MKTVDIREAKRHLSRLVDEAVAGEEITITKAGRPVARLVALPKPALRRVPGRLKGLIRISDDFDDPLPVDILRGFGIEP